MRMHKAAQIGAIFQWECFRESEYQPAWCKGFHSGPRLAGPAGARAWSLLELQGMQWSRPEVIQLRQEVPRVEGSTRPGRA
jgi:hypothetical protein